MKINYLFHSGVSVETGDSLFIFDYYRKGFDASILSSYKNVYVLASHNHGDHFDKAILEWVKYKKDIVYIFSYDIPGYEEIASKIKPGEMINIDNIEITALDSTDEGSAFLVKTPECTIFHSGDLNWWHWEGEPDEYNQGMADNFKKEINKLGVQPIDVAFIPVDKRLEYAKYYSIDYLMSAADVKMVCPIHYGGDWVFIKKVKEDLRDREYYNKINFYGR